MRINGSKVPGVISDYVELGVPAPPVHRLHVGGQGRRALPRGEEAVLAPADEDEDEDEDEDLWMASMEGPGGLGPCGTFRGPGLAGLDSFLTFPTGASG